MGSFSHHALLVWVVTSFLNSSKCLSSQTPLTFGFVALKSQSDYFRPGCLSTINGTPTINRLINEGTLLQAHAEGNEFRLSFRVAP